MEKKIIIATMFCFAVLGAAAQGQSQEEFGPINTGAANFLTIPADAAAAGMAGAGIAVRGNANAIFMNGASLIGTPYNGGVAYTLAPWMRGNGSGNVLHTLGGFYAIDRRNIVMAGLRYFHYPRVAAAGDSPAINPKEFAVEAGYARELFNGFSLSGTFRYIRSDMGKIGGAKAADAMGFDLGAYYRRRVDLFPGASWTVGMTLTNLGTKIKYLEAKEEQPLTVKLGGSLDLPFAQGHRAMIAVDGGYRLMPEDTRAFNFSGGVQYTFREMLSIRGGYHYGDKDKADESYATAGAGVALYGAKFDFAWLFAEKSSLIRNSFWLTLSYSF